MFELKEYFLKKFKHKLKKFTFLYSKKSNYFNFIFKVYKNASIFSLAYLFKKMIIQLVILLINLFE